MSRVILDNIVFELQGVGGISKIWYKKIQYFQENALFDVKYVEGPNMDGNIFRKKLKLNKSDIIADKIYPLAFRRYSSVRTKGPGVFHSSYFRTTKNKKMKQVVTVHDCGYEKFSKGFKRSAHIWQKKKALEVADIIISVSHNTKRELYYYYPWIKNKIVRVVPNGADDEFHLLERKPEEITINGVMIRKKKILLYVGGRNFHKNFSSIFNLLETQAANENDLSIIVAGGEKPSIIEINQIKEKGLEDKVRFIGKISNTDLNLLYNMAFCLVFPSFYEGFGIPVIESMRAGCPVLSSDMSSLHEVGGSGGLFFSPENKNDMKEKFYKLFDEKFRKQLIDYGLKRSMEYSWEKTYNAINGIYNELL